MPELPEVETIARELRESNVIGLKIERAEVFWERSLAIENAILFCKKIADQKIMDISRRGKFLVFTLSNDTLLVHLRMTGKFLIGSDQHRAEAHERIRLYLSDGRTLFYEDQRKFGKWYLTTDPELLLKNIGIEPLSKEFTPKVFDKLLEGQKRQIKPLLLDQSFVAGIGNIYADEALWEAQIHPARSAATLTEQEKNALHAAIIIVLKRGVANIGTSLGSTSANYFSVSGRRGDNFRELQVFRRDGLSCPRCGAIICKMVLHQRGTHFCPKCQIL